MATTTNYSWTTPDDTDLVKDGASAIRSLGSAIDSTVFTNAGNAVQKSTIDAKGDLLVGTADNTIARLAVGTNGYTLVADSSTATGLKWEAAGGGFTGCSLYASATSVAFTAYVVSKIPFANEEFDTDAFHDNSTNNTRITIPSGKGGKYLFTFNIGNTTNSGGSFVAITFYKNGATYSNGCGNNGEIALITGVTDSPHSLTGSIIVDAVATDYFEIGYRSGWADGNKTINARFSAEFLGA